MKKKSLGQVAYESSPEGGLQNWGKWEKAPDIVKHVHKQIATSIVMEVVTKIVRDLQSDLWDHERVALWRATQEGYCPYCSSSYLPCYCQRED